MNTIYNTDKLYDRFCELVELDDNRTGSNGQLITFFKWLYDNDFLRNLNEFDYKCLFDDNFDHLCLPILRNNKIAIGIDLWTDYCRIGIDPSHCFNKISSCSIIIRLPLSKREEQKMYDMFEMLLDKKSLLSKDWFKQASTSWCGSFAKFGDV